MSTPSTNLPRHVKDAARHAVHPDCHAIAEGSGESIRKAILAVASAELGARETFADNTGSEISRYRKAVGPHLTQGAWCAAFASYITHKVAPGLVAPSALAKGLMRRFMQAQAFKEAGSSYVPQPGDLIFFDRGDGADVWKGHVGFVSAVDADGTIHTIEGNRADPRFDSLPESQKPHWSQTDPDAVREVSYTPEHLRQQRLLGYGAVDAMVQHHSRQIRLCAPPSLPAARINDAVLDR